jgi:prepilin-type N-terminal cleavage/methylation domain-containing protein/prepilin-type processing-associated H-X9-DG protein
MNRSPRQICAARSGFTLVELLIVIAIVAVLASLLMPVINSLSYRTDIMKCTNNLRQLGMAAHTWAADHNNLFPEIEPDPTAPLQAPTDSGNPRQPLLTALQPYGITEKTVQCPTDIRLGAKSFYATKQSSYMWQVIGEDEGTNAITRYTRRGAMPANTARVQLATDWQAIHPVSPADGAPLRYNILYADGHVLGADQSFKIVR